MDDIIGSLAVAAIFSRGFAVVFAIVLVVIGIGFVGTLIGANTVYKEGVERGYVVYCPQDGSRRWIGECEDED